MEMSLQTLLIDMKQGLNQIERRQDKFDIDKRKNMDKYFTTLQNEKRFQETNAARIRETAEF